MLNHLWFAFFMAAAASGLWHWLVLDDAEVLKRMVDATFQMGRTSVEVAIGLVGMMCFWLGMMKIAEAAGLVQWLGRALSPLFRRLMPEVPAGHPALGSMTLNISANMLGLDNAATPFGLKAMEQLQSLNPFKDTATNAQIMFLVINTASVTLLPVSVLMYRAQMGAEAPASVFLPILFASTASTLAGILACMVMQRLKWDGVLLAAIGLWLGLLAVMGWLMFRADRASAAAFSETVGHALLLAAIFGFLLAGYLRKVPVYETFIEGAKEGFEVAIRLIPYLVAMLVAIGLLRASGALEAMISGIVWLLEALHLPTGYEEALPTAFLKSLSGSAARASMIEVMQTHGVDSYPALVAATLQGSSETTLYVLTVYCGAVGIRRVRHALGCGLLADAASVLVAIIGVSLLLMG